MMMLRERRNVVADIFFDQNASKSFAVFYNFFLIYCRHEKSDICNHPWQRLPGNCNYGSVLSRKLSQCWIFLCRWKNIVDKHALRSLYVISKFTVLGPIECFRKCRLECKCISLNYWMTKKENNCELNKENRYLKPLDLKPQPGAQHYDLVIDYNVVRWFTVALQCYSYHTILPLFLLGLGWFRSLETGLFAYLLFR